LLKLFAAEHVVSQQEKVQQLIAEAISKPLQAEHVDSQQQKVDQLFDHAIRWAFVR